jgi:hypothetical protein
VTIGGIEVEAAALSAVAGEIGILTVTVPMSDSYAEISLKPLLPTCRERFGSGEHASNRQATKDVLAEEIYQRIKRTRIDMEKEIRKSAYLAPQIS